jgi:hypothetical protein
MPIYMAQKALGATRFLAVVSGRTRSVADLLNEALREEEVDCLDPVEVSAYDLPAATEALRGVLAKLGKEGQVVVNLTGGTKIMALAAYLVAAPEIPCCYVSTETEELLFLEKGRVSKVPLRVEVSLREYLAVHGFDIVKTNEPSEDQKELARAFGTQAAEIASLLESLHEFSKGEGATARIQCPTPQEEVLVRQLEERNILCVEAGKGPPLRFGLADTSWQTFLCGGWLEVYTFEALRESGRWDEVSCGLVVRAVDGSFENEFDVAAIRNGQLCLFSCKSGRNLLKAADKARRAMEELGFVSRRERLGTYCQCFLVTASRDVKDAIRSRAQEWGIHLILLSDLPQLANVVVERLEATRKRGES